MTSVISDYIAFFEAISPASLEDIDHLFAPDAVFQDPFNTASGRQEIKQVFEHMFATCHDPQFRVTEHICANHSCYLHWQFTFGKPDRRKQIDGVSRIRFNQQQQVSEHIDYWDPARQLYEDIPVLRLLLKQLRRKLSALQR